MSASVHRYLSAVVLATWGVTLGYFCVSGRLSSYLHPSFHLFAAITAIIFLLLAGGVLWLPMQDDSCCESHGEHRCGREKTLRSVLTALLVLAPLLAAAKVSPDQYGPAIVTNRGFIGTINNLPGYKPYVETETADAAGSRATSADAGNSAEDYLPVNKEGQIRAQNVDLIFAAEDPTMRADLEGKQIELIGQFMPARDHNKDDRFNLVRMFVMCCAADARPSAVAIQTRELPPIAEMSWVRVVGMAAFPVEDGRTVPLVFAESVTRCDPPEETFIY
jgi:uncharacterized repeat protein (TIGR03943 family)